MNIQWIGSPNYDTNRKPINKIIIHWIVGNLAAADATFTKTSAGTSAHYGVEDSTIHQYVLEQNVAYHAGVYSVNQESVGIEHSASPDRPASESTYKTSGELIYEIAKRYNIPLDRQHILKHSEVKATQCCGTVDVDKLISIAKSFAAPQPLPTPNPGYAPTFEGQDVMNNGIHYKSYKKDGVLLWKIEPNDPPVDYKKKYEEEVVKTTDLTAQIGKKQKEIDSLKEENKLLSGRISAAKVALG